MGKKIPQVTADNVKSIPFTDMLDGIALLVLEPIPEGAVGDAEAVSGIDVLLGRFANLYAYLIHLYVITSYEANRLRLMDATEEYKLQVRKRDALFEFAGAVKMKWRACSRMLTAHIEEEDSPFDKADLSGREASRDKRRGKKGKMRGWQDV